VLLSSAALQGLQHVLHLDAKVLAHAHTQSRSSQTQPDVRSD
jgi:hypothetical protein